jgi:hypothetical protein
MSGILSANPAVRRREEAILTRARMDRIDAQLNKLVEAVTPAPDFTDADVEELGKLLVEGRIRLPCHVRITVTTEVGEIRSREFGTTSTVYTHTADQLCCHQLRPMNIQAALEAGLLAKLGGHWIWRADVYRKLVPADPRLHP